MMQNSFRSICRAYQCSVDSPEFQVLGSCRLIGCQLSVPLNDWRLLVMLPQPGS